MIYWSKIDNVESSCVKYIYIYIYIYTHTHIFAQNNKTLKVFCSIELNVLFCCLFFNFSKSELFLFHTTYFHWLVEFRISDVLIVFSLFFSSSSNSIWIMMMQCVTLWIDTKSWRNAFYVHIYDMERNET